MYHRSSKCAQVVTMVTAKPMTWAVPSFLPKNPAPRPKIQWCALSPQEERPPSQWCASFLWFRPEGCLGVSAASAVARTLGPEKAPAAGGGAAAPRVEPCDPGPSRHSPKDRFRPSSWGSPGSHLSPEEESAHPASLFSIPRLSRSSPQYGPKQEERLCPGSASVVAGWSDSAWRPGPDEVLGATACLVRRFVNKELPFSAFPPYVHHTEP